MKSQEFDPSKDRISTYLERVKLFYKAYGIADNKKSPSVLSMIGGKVYLLLSNLLAPEKSASKSFVQLSEETIRPEASSCYRKVSFSP